MAEGVGFEPTEARRPQRLSRPSHSSALASFRRARLAAGGEELDEEGGAAVGFDAADDGQAVIEAGVGDEVHQRTGGSGLRVGGAVNESLHASIDERPGAHRTRFEGDDQRAVVEAPVADNPGGVADGEDLCVGRWVAGELALVAAGGDDLAGAY